MQHIQMQLSQNQKCFRDFFLNFRNLHKTWNTLKKTDEPQSYFFSEIIDCKKRVYLNAQKASRQNTYGE